MLKNGLVDEASALETLELMRSIGLLEQELVPDVQGSTVAEPEPVAQPEHGTTP